MVLNKQKLLRLLLEFNIKKADPNKLNYGAKKLADPHIKAMIKSVAAKFRVPESEILAKMQSHIDKIKEMAKYSKILHETALELAVNSAAYYVLLEHIDNSNFVKFDAKIFIKLIKRIQLETPNAFWPLRSKVSGDEIRDIIPIYVPSFDPKNEMFNQVSTAACTAHGDFIFNVEFMQKLMDWYTISATDPNQIKPKGTKYDCNTNKDGKKGDIPAAYAPLEFVIIHEFFHYIRGDFERGQTLSQYSHFVHNIAQDFVTNYTLLKNGYYMPPMVLISKHLNMDVQKNYDEIVKIVHEELTKMPQELQNEFEKIAEEADHHEAGNKNKGPDPKDKKPKEAKPKDKKPKEAKPVKPPKVGDVVKNKKNGKFGKVTEVNTITGKVTIVPLTDEEVKKGNYR